MALFEVEVTMNYGDRHWQNRWDVTADDITTVIGSVDAFHDFHLATLLEIYTLGRILVRPAGERDAFFETVYDQAGTVPLGSDKPLPLFDTVRILLNTAVGGRPGQKFIRGFLVAGHLLGSGLIAPTALGVISTNVNALLAATSALGVVISLTNGKEVVTATEQAVVQMRQLHRKRKKTGILG